MREVIQNKPYESRYLQNNKENLTKFNLQENNFQLLKKTWLFSTRQQDTTK